MFEIEKGIELPEINYPHDELEVGDSFLMKCPRGEYGRWLKAKNRFEKKTGRKLVSRGNCDGTRRVWRIV